MNAAARSDPTRRWPNPIANYDNYLGRQEDPAKVHCTELWPDQFKVLALGAVVASYAAAFPATGARERMERRSVAKSIGSVLRSCGRTVLGDPEGAERPRNNPFADARLHKPDHNIVLIHAAFAKPLNDLSRLNIDARPTAMCGHGAN